MVAEDRETKKLELNNSLYKSKGLTPTLSEHVLERETACVIDVRYMKSSDKE